eukprot:m.34715 g.34715  ORF g.34715 m.34715 type:complete len:138 (+) comp17022_c0_seq1:163-576(+)
MNSNTVLNYVHSTSLLSIIITTTSSPSHHHHHHKPKTLHVAFNMHHVSISGLHEFVDDGCIDPAWCCRLKLRDILSFTFHVDVCVVIARPCSSGDSVEHIPVQHRLGTSDTIVGSVKHKTKASVDCLTPTSSTSVVD